jgi:signal transduction histidine kinase/DNA-binding response OmpR family regulator
MTMHREMGLAAKLNILVITLIMISAVTSATLVVVQLRADGLAGLHEEGKRTARQIAAFSHYAIYTEDRASLEHALVGADERAVYLALLRKDGTALIERRRGTFAPAVVLPGLDGADQGRGATYDLGEALQFVWPIVSQGSPLDSLDGGEEERPELLGYVNLVLSKQPMRRQINSAIWATIWVTTVIALLAIGVTMVLTRRITTPVAALVKAIQQITRGDLTSGVEAQGATRELVSLAESFNMMVERLRRSEAEVRQHREGLENKVAERTWQLQEAKEAAESADRAKSRFLASMSHELRTPMNAVLGMTRLALEGELAEDQRRRLGMVRDAAEQLLALLNNILDLAKMENSQLLLCPAPFSLAGLLDSVVAVVTTAAQEKGLTVALQKDQGLPEVVLGDELRLRQIFVNLLGNALKFTEKGGITIKVAMEPVPGGIARVLHCRVIDTGIGISAAKLEAIFKSFQQGDDSYNRQYGGSGLGLAISRKLTELMGGTMWVESTEGSGATFHFTVQLDEVAESPLSPAAGQEATPRGRPDMGLGTGPVTIMVVEDTRTSQELARMFLEQEGYRVVVANHGLAALHLLAREDVHAVLMDIQMPVMDGLAATRAIRALEKGAGCPEPLSDALCAALFRRLQGRRLPVIALTAHAMAEDRAHCLAAGLDDYLTKPMLPNQVRACLRKFLGEAAGAPAEVETEQAAPVARGLQTVAAVRRYLQQTTQLADSQVETLLQMARSGIAGSLAKAQAALQEGDLGQVAGVVHTLKGTLLQCGLPDWAEKCQRLITAARAGAEQPYHKWLQELHQGLAFMDSGGEQGEGPSPEVGPDPGRPGAAAGPDGGPARILVMDDDVMVRKIAVSLLRSLGYEVDSCEDGGQLLAMYQEALEENRPYGVVLMDLLVPGGLGGEETIKALLELDPGVKAIVCSGDPTLPIMADCQAFGFYGALAKPFSRDVLARVLADVGGR